MKCCWCEDMWPIEDLPSRGGVGVEDGTGFGPWDPKPGKPC